MTKPKQLETILAGQLRLRGLARAPGELAFTYRGDVVRVSIGESIYRGLVVTVHDGASRRRQFRAIDGTYDWDAIAGCIVDVAEQRRAERRGRGRTAPQPAAAAPFTIAPSLAPGRMRVNVANMDLEPAAAMQIYALLRQAGAVG